ncbi:MAG: Na+/H+ antiporter subunit E [Chloroflexota bacterium]
MTLFLINILLAFVWMALNGEFTGENFVVGYVLGFGVLWLVESRFGRTTYTIKMLRLLNFLRFFLWELTLANFKVAQSVFLPNRFMSPGVVAIPLSVTSPEEISLLANLITLTPGTLSLDVSTDQRTLYVHAMHVDDLDEFRDGIKNGFEKRVHEVFQ